MNLTEITDKIQEKLGKEESGKIADDIANILIFEESNNKTLKEKDDKISKLRKKCYSSNGNLLLQVPKKDDLKRKKEKPNLLISEVSLMKKENSKDKR